MAQRLDHFRVRQRGLNDQTNSRFGQQQTDGHQHQHGDQHHETAVQRKLHAIQREQRPCEQIRHPVIHRAAAPNQLHQLQNDVTQPECDEQLGHVAKVVHFAQCVLLEQGTHDAHQQRCNHQRWPEAQVFGHGEAQVSPHHVERCVCKVQHAHHAEDERQARAEHEQQQPIADAIEQRYGEKFHGFTGVVQSLKKPAPCTDSSRSGGAAKHQGNGPG